MKRRILVSSALPYANGPIHLGHITEVVQTDIWVRALQMQGHQVTYVCAEDTHGTPAMLRAEREGVTPEELVERMAEEHAESYRGFGIGMANFYTTHSPENRELSELIYRRLEEGGHIAVRPVVQFFDPEREMFLPDRFVKGTCPKCKTPDQYGDSCDSCGSTYTPQDLIEPYSVLTGSKPVEKESEHFFLKLADFEEELRAWVSTDRAPGRRRQQAERVVRTKASRTGDISRDAPYFGFEIPGAPGKYFYVWLDAPIGYMASSKELASRTDLDWDAYWYPPAEDDENPAELYHFIGKDILYFHCLFWPAMLHGAGFRMPNAVFVHGFLTVDGAKMSKSRGTFIKADTYLEHLPADPLRYYLAGKLGPTIADLDWNLEDFVLRVNSDLVGKLVNIASRCAGFLHKRFGGRLGEALDRPELYESAAAQSEEIARLFEAREYNRAIRQIMAVCDEANRYIDERKPLGAGEGGRQRGRAARGAHHRHQHVQDPDHLAQAGDATHRSGGGRVPRRRPAAVERRSDPAARPCGQPVPAAHAAPGAEADRSAAGAVEGRGRGGGRGWSSPARPGRSPTSRSRARSSTTTSPRSTCAWPRSRRPSRSTGRRSCCG